MRGALIVAAALLVAGCGQDDIARVRPLSVGISSDRTVVGVTSSYADSISCAEDPVGVDLALDGDVAIVTALIADESGADACTAECGIVYQTLRLDEPLPADVEFVAAADDEASCWGAPAGPIDPEYDGTYESGTVAAALTVDLPCANRLMAASEDDHFELTVEWAGEYLEAPDEQIEERTVELPDANWIARFEVGHDLSATVPCTDVLAENGAVATVDVSYEVTGRLEIEELPAATDGLAVATLYDGAFTLTDGTRVELGTITLENPRFGFFAG